MLSLPFLRSATKWIHPTPRNRPRCSPATFPRCTASLLRLQPPSSEPSPLQHLTFFLSSRVHGRWFRAVLCCPQPRAAASEPDAFHYCFFVWSALISLIIVSYSTWHARFVHGVRTTDPIKLSTPLLSLPCLSSHHHACLTPDSRAFYSLILGYPLPSHANLFYRLLYTKHGSLSRGREESFCLS